MYQQVFVPVQQVVQPKRVATTKQLTLDQKIKTAQENVEYESKRLFTCGWIFVVVGAIGFFCGINSTFHARTEAAFLYDMKQLPWGNPNYTNWTILNATTQTSDRMELVTYDLIRELHLIKSSISFIIVMMGLAALAAINRGKALFAKKMFQRFFFTFATFIIFYVYQKKQHKNFNYVVKYIQTGSFTSESEMPKLGDPIANLGDAPAWPTPVPLEPHMLFFFLGSIYVMSLLKFIEKSYAQVKLYKYAKTLVKMPAAQQPVTQAPSQMVFMPVQQVKVDDVEAAIQEDKIVSKNTMN